MKKTMLMLSAVLLIVGAVLLCLSIFTARTSVRDGRVLPGALLCMFGADTINMIRLIKERKDK